MTRMKTTVIGITAALLHVCAMPVLGQANYPSRPVTVIVPYAPGGTTDIEARLYTQKVGERLGQPYIIDYKPLLSGVVR